MRKKKEVFGFEKTEFGYDIKKGLKEKVFSTIEIKKDITYDMLENIMVSAIEGGINYWAGIDLTTDGWDERIEDMPISQHALLMLTQGKSIKLYDIEEDANDEDSKDWILTIENLLNGIKLYCEENEDNLEDGDAATFDSIIQFALFEEVVYG